MEDILAYKDISIFGNGADFLLLTEDGIHYKDSGTDYDFLAFNDIAKVNKYDNEISVIGKSPLQFGPLMPVPHIITIKYLDEPGILASYLKTVKTLFELK